MPTWNSMQELFDLLIQMPDLHSIPKFRDDGLSWYLYKDAYLRVYCAEDQFYIELVGASLSNSGSVRWLADKNSMLQELYALGKRGNLCVVKKTLFGSSVFYMGDPSQCPVADKRGWDLGKKKYDFGTLIYLEQK